jgi:hypothetical protein
MYSLEQLQPMGLVRWCSAMAVELKRVAFGSVRDYKGLGYMYVEIGEIPYLVNDKYSEFTIVPATMANMQNVILKRVVFRSVRDL